MSDLTTKYLGLNLRNPVIVSSSSLTNNINGIVSCTNSGAGAVVLKSLFEEQITSELASIEQDQSMDYHPEAADYVRKLGMDLKTDDYLNLIEKSKQEVDIPIIASLNCISSSRWVDYAKSIEEAGADALELNIALMPKDFHTTPEEIENKLLEIVKAVKKTTKLPLAVKIGPYFTSIPKVVQRLENAGVNGLVLFNRFYRPDVDIEKLEIVPGYRYSSPEEISLPLRWIGILSRQVKCDLAGSTGVYDGAGVVKHLLAGANVVMICSTVYVNGFKQISIILDRVKFWMQTHNYASLDNFRGILSHKDTQKPAYYERLQYIKALVGIE
ncbi:MAG: dihydroorotate dehydrogenase-like protein [Candidatus Cyclobacteriaceae bacterium M3_2C_046]